MLDGHFQIYFFANIICEYLVLEILDWNVYKQCIILQSNCSFDSELQKTCDNTYSVIVPKYHKITMEFFKVALACEVPRCEETVFITQHKEHVLT